MTEDREAFQDYGHLGLTVRAHRATARLSRYQASPYGRASTSKLQARRD